MDITPPSTPGEPEGAYADAVPIRAMRPDDLEKVVAIDAAAGGPPRPGYFEKMLERSLTHADLQVSLAAEVDGRVVGFVVATVFYGEFGVAETAATLDAIGVNPSWRHRGVGRSLMRQLCRNLGALRVSTLRTEVAWDDFELLGFFRRHGFAPGRRLCLERDLDPTAPDA